MKTRGYGPDEHVVANAPIEAARKALAAAVDRGPFYEALRM